MGRCRLPQPLSEPAVPKPAGAFERSNPFRDYDIQMMVFEVARGFDIFEGGGAPWESAGSGAAYAFNCFLLLINAGERDLRVRIVIIVVVLRARVRGRGRRRPPRVSSSLMQSLIFYGLPQHTTTSCNLISVRFGESLRDCYVKSGKCGAGRLRAAVFATFFCKRSAMC